MIIYVCRIDVIKASLKLSTLTVLQWVSDLVLIKNFLFVCFFVKVKSKVVFKIASKLLISVLLPFRSGAGYVHTK